jgi:hypothetical protein
VSVSAPRHKGRVAARPGFARGASNVTPYWAIRPHSPAVGRPLGGGEASPHWPPPASRPGAGATWAGGPGR